MHDLDDFVPDYRAEMAVSPQEFADLASRQHHYSVARFKPNCDWVGTAIPAENEITTEAYGTFTNPVFSTKGDLALVEVSFGTFYGVNCAVRSSGGTWRADCLRSWIS